MYRNIKISGFHSLKVSLLLSLLIIIIIIIIVNNLCNYITTQIIPDNVLECVTLTYQYNISWISTGITGGECKRIVTLITGNLFSTIIKFLQGFNSFTTYDVIAAFLCTPYWQTPMELWVKKP